MAQLLPCWPTAGEVAEWKAELVDRHKQKDALKKIIAAMTIGKDVSSVFAEVTSCSQTADLEVKKLVYLYLINYAKSQPELAILAVNTFVKVRPMGRYDSCMVSGG
jgi:AP-1 complex subunit beta-1